MAGGELSEVASVTFAVGVAFGDFGEWLAAFQFRQGRLDPGARLLLALFAVDVLHDVRGLKQLRVTEILAVGFVKCLHLLWRWSGRPGDHCGGSASILRSQPQEFP